MGCPAIRTSARTAGRLPLALALVLILAWPAAGFGSEWAGMTLTPSYAIAMHGEPALPEDFDHLPYADPRAPKGGRVTLGFEGTFDSLNPFNLKAGSTAQGLIGNVFQTLMARSRDEPFTLYGLIAKSIETDAARTHVIFHLDPNARFSDGESVTAADVLFTFDLLRTKGRPQQRAAFSLVRSIDTPDPLTVRFDLSGLDDREMPLTLALMPVLPHDRVDPARFENSSLDISIGSGPYVISSVDPGQSIVLTRNPDYWAKDLPISRGLYNFDEIKIEYFRDANALFEAFKAGLIDYRDESDPTRWLDDYDFPALEAGRVVKESLPIGTPKGMQGFVFNMRHPLFADIRLREALGMMFDFQWINPHLYGGLFHRTKSFFDESDLASTGRPASAEERTLLAPFAGAVRADVLAGRWAPPLDDGSGRDRTLAKRALTLLDEGGYEIDDGALRNRQSGEPVSFEIMVTTRSQERLALIYADSLARIGVDAHVSLVDEVQYQRRRQTFDFDMMIGSWIASASPGNEQRARWGSASAEQQASFNLAGVKSPAVDALISDMLAAKTNEEFVTAVRAYDRVLLSGFYIVPLFHTPDEWIAYSSKLGRPQNLPRFAAPLFGATLDTWWRKMP
jgi:peptide/nickel transport system substrate-binding protein